MICHAGWVPVTADILRGKTGTSTKKIKADLEGAGMTWVDKEVVVSENIISSRSLRIFMCTPLHSLMK